MTKLDNLLQILLVRVDVIDAVRRLLTNNRKFYTTQTASLRRLSSFV
ncbi:hypothetical protein [Mastigocladopsis repens]|nr:hypothetical protein [Mastigocladopsis repens]